MFEIRAYNETESTNDDAATLLGTPAGKGVVLLADYQRAGRGRRSRAWIAPAGSALLFTTLLPTAIPSEALWAVPFWTALCVAVGIEEATGARVALQWPNDLLLERNKCCGILCISRVSGTEAWVACGTGINVSRPSDDDGSLAAIEPPPAFLSDRIPGVQRKPVLDAILRAYEHRLSELQNPEGTAREWERRAELDGTPYRILLDGTSEPLNAIARRIGSGGSLVVETDDAERAISLADARVLR
ncbi:MAG: biotin--[acetyl-CoA-carboxylase] ligase [Candidatus Eremiobacteraeota bacterium]|nr:biotin--[acetyl-CoA-carboxylase] ligase [Candidatus Eremiobacteraeota bacterium]